MKYQLHIGHALEILKTMPDESVQCCVTSPPYWGLRQYDIPDTVFGGIQDCDHEWGNNIPPRGQPGWHTFEHKYDSPGCHGGTIGKKLKKEPEKLNRHGFLCQKCGAWKGQLGLEPTPELYVEHIVKIFREVLRVLRSDGTLWLNLGDCYATGAGLYGNPSSDVSRENNRRNGRSKNSFTKDYPTHQPNRMPIQGLKPKDLVGIPWRVAFALQADGWCFRRDIIWSKPNPMPESCQDRPTTSHEYIFLFSKSYTKKLWRHKETKQWSYKRPKADWAWFDKSRLKISSGKLSQSHYILTECKRLNLWRGFDYYYDHEAIKELVTGNAHPRCNGVNPKCKVPNGWDTSKGTGGHGKIHKSGRTSGTRYKVKQNESFSASVTDLVDSRNKRSVWTVSTHPYPEAHFATFPPKLIEPCVLAGCPEGGTVLDPFAGSGTTGEVALKHFRKFIGIDLGDGYINDMARPRVEAEALKYKNRDLFDTPPKK